MKVVIQSAADLGRVIRASRKAQGLRLDDVAGGAQLSPVFVGDAERGKDSAQIGKVLHLMRELGVKLSVEIPDSFQPHLDRLTAQGIRPAKKRPAGFRSSTGEKSE